MTYDANYTYATVEQLESKATAAGWLHIADRDGDDTVSTAELDAVKEEVEAANNVIDAALSQWMPLATARGSGNDWLRDRCLHIAMYFAATLGGREAPISVADNYDDALKYLEQVKDGSLRVPGLTYPQADTRRTTRTPRAINPGRRRR